MERIVECNIVFDTYKGETLKAKLTKQHIPDDNGLNIPMGDYDVVKFFTYNGYSHEGGWAFGGFNDWANRVNEDLFKRRVIENRDIFLIKDFYEKSNNKLCNEEPTFDHYYYRNGIKYVNGDIIKSTLNCNYETYSLIHWSYCCGGELRNWHYALSFYNDTRDYRGNRISFDGYQFYSRCSVEKLSPKEGYAYLCDGARKKWRKIHNVKGRPKFKK